MTKAASLRVAKLKRPPSVLICAKCVKNAPDGKAVREALKAGLIADAEARGARPGRLLMTRCMGVCPKRAVVVTNGALLGGGEVLLVRNADDVSAALERLRRERRESRVARSDISDISG